MGSKMQIHRTRPQTIINQLTLALDYLRDGGNGIYRAETKIIETITRLENHIHAVDNGCTEKETDDYDWI